MNLSSPAHAIRSLLGACFDAQDCDATLACLFDEIVWFGADGAEAARGKRAVCRLLMRVAEHAAGKRAVSVSDMTETMLTADCGIVSCSARIDGRADGDAEDCSIGATCVRQGEAFLVAALHMALPVEWEAAAECIDHVPAEEALRIREEEYRLAIAHGGKLIYRYTHADRSIDMPEAVAALFGLPQRVGNMPQSVVDTGALDPESVGAFLQFYELLQSGEKTGNMTIRRRISDGTYRWYDARFSNIFNDAGEPVSAVILFEDITTVREEQIVSGLDRERLTVALRTVYPVAISINLTQGRYKVLGSAEQLFAVDAEGRIDDLIRAVAKRLTPEFCKDFLRSFSCDALLNSFASGVETVHMEYRQRLDDGPHWIETIALRVNNVYDSDVMGVVLCRGIDEQKASEERLRQALALTSDELSKERWYQRILDDNIPVGTVIFRFDDSGTPLHVGGTMLAELGYTKEEFIAFQEKRLRGFVLDEDYGTAFHDMRSSPVDPVQTFEQEYRVVKKDGSIVWIYEKGSLIQVEDGEPGYLSIFLNVTRRKEMEDRLRVSEEEMRLAMAQMGKMVCIYDPVARTLTMPEAYARRYGIEAVMPDVPEATVERGVLDPDSRAPYLAFYESILRGEPTGAVEYYIRGADGQWRWERAEFATVFSRDKKPLKAIVSVEDTTAQHAKEHETEALRENERLLRMVAAHSNRQIFRYDIASKALYTDGNAASPAIVSLTGMNVPDSVIEKGIVLQESVDDFLQAFQKIHDGAPNGSAKVHMLAADGAPHWMDMRYSIIEQAGGRPKYAVMSFADITDDHEKELAYQRYHQTINDDTSAAGMVYFETDLTSDTVEKQGGNIPHLAFPPCGCTHMEAVNYGVDNLVAEDERPRARAFFAREHLITLFSDNKRSLTEDWPADFPGAGRRWFRSDIEMVSDPYSDHIKAYIVLRDVTDEKLAALEVIKKAEVDGNTGLYNKTTTESRIRQRLENGGGNACTLLVADLDDLKSINDHLGHAQGDNALRQVSATLRDQFRQTDIVGRIGGDEFMAYLDGAGSEAALRSSMTTLMRKIATLRIGENNDVPVHMSIGVAFGTAGKDSFDTLYRKADRALYHVKRNGKNDYAFYTPDMDEAAYRYAGHIEATLWRGDAFDKAELDRLVYAISTIYPLVISVNLTQNSYYMMQYGRYTTAARHDAGVFDELIEEGASTFHPDDRESFLNAFSRRNLLKAYARGERIVSHQGRQLGDDGVYRSVCTDVIFVRSVGSDDVMEITLGRVLGT